jgi:anti-sigma-K factor RskA
MSVTNKNGEIACKQAEELYHQISEKDGAELAAVVEKLGKLSEEFEHEEMIAKMYVIGLLKQSDELSCEQYGTDMAPPVKKLRQLVEDRFKNNAEITEIYAMKLSTMSFEQNGAALASTAEKLRQLAEDRFKDNEDLALRYATSLVNLSSVQDAVSAAATVEKLRCLSEEQFGGDTRIAIEYARSLVNLSSRPKADFSAQAAVSAAETLAKLRQLSKELSEKMEETGCGLCHGTASAVIIGADGERNVVSFAHDEDNDNAKIMGLDSICKMNLPKISEVLNKKAKKRLEKVVKENIDREDFVAFKQGKVTYKKRSGILFADCPIPEYEGELVFEIITDIMVGDRVMGHQRYLSDLRQKFIHNYFYIWDLGV